MASTCLLAHVRPSIAAPCSVRTGLPRPWGLARPAPACVVLVRAKPQDGKQELDPIEKMVSFFFPKALSDPAPMGLKRINFDELPDQYCEMDTLAPLLPGDERSPDVSAIRPLLARTQLERRSLKLAFDADLDGWSPAAFHAKVDGQGAAVVLATTAGGAVLGGYNPEGWIGLGEDRASNGAFLFSWPDGNTKQRAYKIAKVGGPNLAVIDNPSSGPQFGADGLTIPLKPRGQERLAKCKLGTYYARLPDGSRTLFSGGDDPKKAELVSLKVYVADAKGVEWRLEGITWKSVVVEN
ncbi:hypothetical protein CHLRE_10g446500v5 [Chlamydomonas reinhardtii]|uniref:Uncharacterized protein n=1 Tax=Chlamydomonas reinhardtii TaxID=3055 RepID=A8HZ83_CHLRE|nr:uncharacterized protein CHLRE_10g446500v5 [Chlamydomonas reinhardtii]PNW77669.1 hypothetical protein CHLRE_10g446500v5 [Chlamydomonas reinhardtii]|eukprot:XP_001698470.1 predicted protein [Chlamydomonas reinhardtii]